MCENGMAVASSCRMHDNEKTCDAMQDRDTVETWWKEHLALQPLRTLAN